MAEQSEKHLAPEVWAWVQQVAARDHGGDWKAAVAAILTAAYESEREPGNPWRYLEERVSRGPQSRPGRANI